MARLKPISFCIFTLLALSWLSIQWYQSYLKQAPTLEEAVLGDLPDLQTGDLLFRRTNGIGSIIADWFDKNGIFSHVGIVYLENDQAYVVNVVPNGDKTVQVQRIQEFIREANALALYRPRPEIAPLAAQAAEYAAHKMEGLPYDIMLNDESDNAVYCTELVEKAFQAVGLKVIDEKPQKLLPFLPKTIFYPSQLMKSPYFEMRYQRVLQNSENKP